MPDLPHIASRLYGMPLLIARGKLDVILSALGPRLSGQALSFDGEPAPTATVEVTPDGIAIVPVIGTLVSRSGYLGAASGLSAYGDIAEAIEAAATDPAVRAILLDIDSPGGDGEEAARCRLGCGPLAAESARSRCPQLVLKR